MAENERGAEKDAADLLVEALCSVEHPDTITKHHHRCHLKADALLASPKFAGIKRQWQADAFDEGCAAGYGRGANADGLGRARSSSPYRPIPPGKGAAL